jgi:protein-S-isoprenylcysteine O-methyltransferase Ste14
MGRRLVIACFGTLAALSLIQWLGTVEHAFAHSSTPGWLDAGFGLIRCGVVSAFLAFVITRGPARRPGREPLAVAACAFAILPVFLLQSPGSSTSPALALGGEILAGVAAAWTLAAVLSLGRCFSVLPEARGLVTSGAYRFVRHPVYLGEFGACAGMLVASPTLRNVIAAAVFAAAQNVRMHMEEGALVAEFPEYRDYAARTPRLVPRPRFQPRLVAREETT